MFVVEQPNCARTRYTIHPVLCTQAIREKTIIGYRSRGEPTVGKKINNSQTVKGKSISFEKSGTIVREKILRFFIQQVK